jgi:type I restriction enzyme S subunit
MTKQRKKVPALRFKGFTDDWEQRKLGEIGSFRSGVGFPESEQGGTAGIPFYKVSDMNLSENNTVMNISSNYVTDDQISRNKWKPIDGNTIIFAKVGAAVFLERKRQTRCKFLIDNNMMSYKPNSIQDHDYIYYTFQNLNLSHYAQIGSLPSLNAGELKNVNIVLPDQNEQSKVSQLFLNLDRTITLHEEKQRQLERLKKALLQKMFADETGYPALRFKGFTEKWEQHKLGEITDVRDGTHDSPHYVDEGYPLITSKNVSNGRINYDAVNYVSEYDFNQINKRSKVNINDILMGMIGTIGNLALIREDPNFAIKNVALIKYTESINHQFLFQNLQTSYISKELSNSMDGGTQKFISLKKIRNLSIKFPILNEQFEIGQLFQSLDKIITLHDKKIQYLKQLKRGLLQKMFV